MSELAHHDLGRRTLLKGGLMALATGPLLAACGVNTSGSGGEGSVNFLSTQFSPVEERQRYEATLKKFAGNIQVAYNCESQR